MMLRPLLLLCLFGIPQCVFTQTPHLLEEDKQWTVEYADYIIIPPVIDQVSYAFEGDTLISGVTYGKFGNGAFLREDTLSQKVFLYFDSGECLLYDFQAATGDTLELCYGLQEVIDSISTITTQDGISRKKLHTSGENALGLYWMIEGIGSNLGLVEIGEAIGPPTLDLMCVKKDGNTVYGARCSEVLNTKSGPSELIKVNLYPNPGDGPITIDSSLPLQKIQVFDAAGSMVFTRFPKGAQRQIINLSKGLYRVVAYSTSNQLIASKWVVIWNY